MPFETVDFQNPTYNVALKLCATYFPTHIPKSPVYILSTSGCGLQIAHCDTACGDVCAHKDLYSVVVRDEIPPLSVLVVFDKLSEFVLWENSRNVWDMNMSDVPLKSTRLILPRYSVLFFRQDLVHCGCDYSTDNVRAHFYLDRSDVVRDENLTQHVDVKFFVM